MSDYYVSSAIGNDTTGDGSSGTPYETIQKVLSTHAIGATGDFIYVDNASTQTLTAPLDTASVYGTPSAFKRLHIECWDRTAIGTVAVVDCDSNAMFATTTLTGVSLVQLRVTNNIGSTLVTGNDDWQIRQCQFDAATTALTLRSRPTVTRTYFYDLDGYGISNTARELIMSGCVFRNGATRQFIDAVSLALGSYNQSIDDCLFILDNGSVVIRMSGNCSTKVERCTAIGDSTGKFVVTGSSTGSYQIVIDNNVISGFGTAIDVTSGTRPVLSVSNNLFWDNSTDIAAGIDAKITNNNATAGSDPFVDASSEDYRLVAMYAESGVARPSPLPAVTPGACGAISQEFVPHPLYATGRR